MVGFPLEYLAAVVNGIKDHHITHLGVSGFERQNDILAIYNGLLPIIGHRTLLRRSVSCRVVPCLILVQK